MCVCISRGLSSLFLLELLAESTLVVHATDSATAEVSWDAEVSAGEEPLNIYANGNDVRPFARTLHQDVSGSTPIGTIQLGTPPVNLNVIFDTGSDRLVAKTWDTVIRELERVDGAADDAVMPSKLVYNHNASLTYKQEHTREHGRDAPKRGYIVYGSGAVFTNEGKDTVSVGGVTLTTFPFSEIIADSLSMLHMKGGASGVLGLQHMKNRSVGESLFSRSRDLGLMFTFSYCHHSKSASTFIWGDRSTEGHRIPVIGAIHWAVRLANIELSASRVRKDRFDMAGLSRTPYNRFRDDDDGRAGRLAEDIREPRIGELAENGLTGQFDPFGSHLHFPAQVVAATYAPLPLCADGPCAAVIDTGSNIIAGPGAALRTLIRDLAVKFDCSNLADLPSIRLWLGGIEVTLPPSAYIMKVKLPSWAKGRWQRAGSPRQSMSRLSTNHETEAGQDEDAGNPWQSALEDLHVNRGLDLRHALEGVPLNDLLSREQLCMPAFVPLDRDTRLGALWVIGGPLFSQYYTRWSWGEDEEAPSIFIKDLRAAAACQRPGSLAGNSEVASAAGLMRSEVRHTARVAAHDAATAPGNAHSVRELDMDEIMYPHWARELPDL